MAQIEFVHELTVDTNIPFDDWTTRFETNAIVQHMSGAIGRVIYIEQLNLHVMVRVNQNTWRCEIWGREHCTRRNIVDKWYHEDPLLPKDGETIQKIFDRLEIDEYLIHLK